jgi:Na+/H+-dicarboxylate symporter
MDDKPFSWTTVIGGIVLAIVVGVVTGPIGAMIGASAGQTIFAWLIAFSIPALALISIWLATRSAGRSFGLGLIIGGSLVILCCGMCDTMLIRGF